MPPVANVELVPDSEDSIATSSIDIANGTNSGQQVEVALEDKSVRDEMVLWGLVCGGFTIFVFLVATLQYYRKRASSPKQRKKRKQRKEKRRKESEEKSIAEVSRDAVSAEEFLDSMKRKRKKGLIGIEFKALNRYQEDKPCQVALLPENRKKNAYPECLPHDHCRVILDSLPDENSSDYINASYIDSYNKPRAYIAAQGPSRHTLNEFWKMVWQEKSHCIVMATNLFEHARQQCEKYWHNQHGRYGDIEVWLENTDTLADFNIRTFKIRRLGCFEERLIKQFQFASWSDHDCPNPSSVLEYRRRIRAFVRNRRGPVIVHCGSGAGRTGTFIAIDALLDRVSNEKNVDTFNYVLKLRNSRQNMVRNREQYEFIYDCIAMYLQCGTTVISANELPAVVQKLAVKDQHSRMNGFEREFKTLQTVVPKLTVGECAGGHRAENRRKSRDIMLQPPERARPYLITHDSNESTDYINAVYVDGYRNTNAYIVTQWPLSSTVNDIWRLVYDYNIPTMVLLHDMPNSRSYPQFWPKRVGQEVIYGPLTVELESQQVSSEITSRVFRVKKPPHFKNMTRHYKDLSSHLMEAGETLMSLQAMGNGNEGDAIRTVKMLQICCWPNGHKVPTSSSALIKLLTKVENWQHKCLGRIPICVISKNGVTRCGCFLAISIAWEKLKAEGEVDVFRAVKTIKMNRTQLVENMVEYIYCYTFMVILLEILTTTQPNTIPRGETSEEDTWDNRERPLVAVESRRKGAGHMQNGYVEFPLLNHLYQLHRSDTRPLKIVDRTPGAKSANHTSGYHFDQYELQSKLFSQNSKHSRAQEYLGHGSKYRHRGKGPSLNTRMHDEESELYQNSYGTRHGKSCDNLGYHHDMYSHMHSDGQSDCSESGGSYVQASRNPRSPQAIHSNMSGRMSSMSDSTMEECDRASPSVRQCQTPLDSPALVHSHFRPVYPNMHKYDNYAYDEDVVYDVFV